MVRAALLAKTARQEAERSVQDLAGQRVSIGGQCQRGTVLEPGRVEVLAIATCAPRNTGLLLNIDSMRGDLKDMVLGTDTARPEAINATVLKQTQHLLIGQESFARTKLLPRQHS